jgi:hypothetical protein
MAALQSSSPTSLKSTTSCRGISSQERCAMLLEFVPQPSTNTGYVLHCHYQSSVSALQINGSVQLEVFTCSHIHFATLTLLHMSSSLIIHYNNQRIIVIEVTSPLLPFCFEKWTANHMQLGSGICLDTSVFVSIFSSSISAWIVIIAGTTFTF